VDPSTVEKLGGAGTKRAFVTFARGGGVCHVGRPCPSNVARFASVPLRPLDLAAVLLGRPPLLSPLGEVADSLGWDGEARAWVFTRTAGTWQQRLWLSAAHDRVLRTRLSEAGRARVNVRYSDFGATPAGDVPRRLAFSLARDDTDLRIDLSRVDVAPGLEASAFTATCPAGMAVEPLPCLEDVNPEPGETP
jgi:hypothetical protein